MTSSVSSIHNTALTGEQSLRLEARQPTQFEDKVGHLIHAWHPAHIKTDSATGDGLNLVRHLLAEIQTRNIRAYRAVDIANVRTTPSIMRY